ncbi:MAG: hypothetical protein ACPG7F_08530 [Aggregatilineales bacterium]
MKFQFTSRQIEIAVIATLLLITSLFMLHVDDTDVAASNNAEIIEQMVEDMAADNTTLITYNNQ